MQVDRYPKIGTTNRIHARNQWGRYARPHSPVKCDACGLEATTRTTIETSWFRGEDDVFRLCSVHTAMARAAEWSALYRDIKAHGQ